MGSILPAGVQTKHGLSLTTTTLSKREKIIVNISVRKGFVTFFAIFWYVCPTEKRKIDDLIQT